MNIASAKNILTKKEPPGLYDLIEPALEDTELRDFLVQGSTEKDETVRYNCVRVLLRAMSRRPQLFYSYWDRFASMIGSPNGFHRSSSSQAIAYLSQVDSDCRLDRLFKQYLALMDDSKVMVTHYFIETLDIVYRARPEFQRRIFSRLVNIDAGKHDPGHQELLKADILGVFDRMFDILSSTDRKKALAFAKAAAESKSPKSRKTAKDFLAKHAG